MVTNRDKPGQKVSVKPVKVLEWLASIMQFYEKK